MNLVIRPATPEDASKIASFNVALARETEQRTLNRRLVGVGVRTLLGEPKHGFYIVADNGKKIVGMAMITFEWSDWLNRQWWWLQSVYVDPAMRRQGVFSKIHGYIQEMAERQGNVAGIRLYVEKENRAALRSYRKLGLQPKSYRFLENPLPVKKAAPKKNDPPQPEVLAFDKHRNVRRI
ncbi:MAG: GNAT family N-acetyltransferase [Chthoniobacterales bacterium]